MSQQPESKIEDAQSPSPQGHFRGDALSESEERYRNLVEMSPEAIMVLQEGRIVFVNGAGVALLSGDEVADILGKSFEEFVHPEYVSLARRRMQHVLDGRRAPVALARLVRLDGDHVDVEVTGARISYRGRPAIQVMARDVSSRREAEERLRLEKVYFERLFESAPQAIVLLDISGRISRANREFTRLFGFRQDELVGQPVDDLIVPPELQDEARALTAAATRGETCTLEGRRRRKDGSLVDVAIVGAPIETERGQVAVYGMYTDITERKRLEQRLRQSHKLEAIGQLAGGIAHDFNNLLTAILGNCEVLLSDLDSRDPLYVDVEEIKRAGERAASLTRQLLAFSRRQYLQPVVLDLNTVVADTEKMMRRLIGENIELVTHLDPSLHRVKADPGQVEQVIVNLAVNARDAMPSGGKLTIETSNDVVDEEFARTHQPIFPGPYVKMTFRDTGEGMDPETQSRIFEPFFTTKEKGRGTGLGLSTVYGIVKQSGGYIWVDSEVSGGTTFTIHLPPVGQRDPADEWMPGEDPLDALGGSETILLVEDEDVVRALVRRLLVRRGYNVLHAADAEQALALAGRYADHIHLLVTDMIMPGIDGRELSRELLEDRPDMRVLYISGYMDILDPQASLEPNASFLQKPFTPDDLARKVREVLDNL